MQQLSRLVGLGLTDREAEVLFWIASGKTNPEIGLILELSRHTVKTHVVSIFEKLEVSSRILASNRAMRALG